MYPIKTKHISITKTFHILDRIHVLTCVWYGGIIWDDCILANKKQKQENSYEQNGPSHRIEIKAVVQSNQYMLW